MGKGKRTKAEKDKEEAMKEAARIEAGVLLPDVDPAVGEIVMATFMANEGAPVAAIVAGLIQSCDPETATEVTAAILELLLCNEKGATYWLETKGNSIMIGSRRVTGRSAVFFGTAEWPISALFAGPPKSAIVRVNDQPHRVWMACTGMQGAVVRQSEAVALGNAMVETFGGRILEDRSGGDVMQQSYLEHHRTKAAKDRASAMDQMDRMAIHGDRDQSLRLGHARVALAEAMPGTLKKGMEVFPEGDPEKKYAVDRRLNDSWVVISALKPGSESNVEACSWIGSGHGPGGKDSPPHWGFSDDPAIAATAAGAT